MHPVQQPKYRFLLSMKWHIDHSRPVRHFVKQLGCVQRMQLQRKQLGRRLSETNFDKIISLISGWSAPNSYDFHFVKVLVLLYFANYLWKTMK